MASRASDPLRSSAGERARGAVLSLLKQHGTSATSFQVLEEGFEYWTTSSGDGVVAYFDTGSAWVAAGAPICSVERAPRVASDFVEAARASGRRACFFAVEEIAALDERAGARTWASMPIGEQPFWTPSEWPAALARSRSLKEQLRRARAKGVTVRRVSAREIAAAPSPGRSLVREEIEGLIDRWLASRKMAPMGFLVDVQPFHYPDERRYLVAEQAGAIIGVLVMVPIYARRGWLFEDLLRAPTAQNGTSELLFDAGMRLALEEGSVYATLGLAPLAGDVSPWLQAARSFARKLYDFNGVKKFKTKLAPAGWSTVHLVWPARQWGLVALFDSLVAFTASARSNRPAPGFLRFGLESLLASPKVTIIALAVLLLAWTAVTALVDVGTWFSAPTWIVFDVALAVALLLLARAFKPRVARALALVTAADALLTLVRAASFDLRMSRGLLHASMTFAACIGPCIATLFLWRSAEHESRLD
ncbi:MAG: DUF2156 domain-containing protein [Polyangiaceae bacterium]